MKKNTIILILIFTAVFIFRLIMSFKSPVFSYDSYFHLRQIEHITTTGLPILSDMLSYGGKLNIFMPLFHYILAFFNLFLPLTIVAKVLTNLFASSVIFAIYLITDRITKKPSAALFAAVIAGFIPIFIFQTINKVSPLALAIPMVFFILYFLMRINQKEFLYLFLIFFTLLIFLHPISLLLVLGMLFYLILLKLEKFNQKRTELETILFMTFLVFWVYFIIFKKIFLFHGPAIIWQNIPENIAHLYFANIGILEAVLGIGLVPFLLGIYMVYKYIFVIRDRQIYLLIGFIISTTILLWLKLISAELGLVLIGITFVILFGQFFNLFVKYLEKTRFSPYKTFIIIAFILLVIITSIIPSYYFANAAISESVPEETAKALQWLRLNKEDNQTVAASVKEGFLISAIAGKPNIADFSFVLIDDVQERLDDLEVIYTSPYKTNAVELLNKYNVGYILFTQQIKDQYNIEKIRYTEDKKCFKRIYEEEETLIFKSICEVEES